MFKLLDDYFPIVAGAIISMIFTAGIFFEAAHRRSCRADRYAECVSADRTGCVDDAERLCK